MLSLLLHPLGSETLPTTERRREKRNSFAVGNKEKKYYDFSSPFAKNMERNFICNRECVWYLQKQLYILCLVTCNKRKALSWTRTCIHKSINFLKNIFSIQSFLLLSVHTVSEYLATRALEKCFLCKSRVFDYSKKLTSLLPDCGFLASSDYICGLSALPRSFPILHSQAPHGGQGSNLCPEFVSLVCSGKGISSELIGFV